MVELLGCWVVFLLSCWDTERSRSVVGTLSVVEVLNGGAKCRLFF